MQTDDLRVGYVLHYLITHTAGLGTGIACMLVHSGQKLIEMFLFHPDDVENDVHD
jgi:hypothetical protein